MMRPDLLPLLRISHEGLELASGDLLHEELIQLLVGATSSLGLAEPEVDSGQHRQGAEDEGNLGSKVGLIGVEQEGDDESPHGLD